MQNHTPGPWKRDGLTIIGTPREWPGQTVGAIRKIPATRVAQISSIPGCYVDYPIKIAEANAALIAAAPDLLAALRESQKQFDAIVSALAQGRTVSISSVQNCAAQAGAAIARATA